MRTRKIWLGLGAFAVVASGAISSSVTCAADVETHATRLAQLKGGARLPVLLAPNLQVAAMKHGGEEGGEEGGHKAGESALGPDLDFALNIALIRGHLLIGDELVQAGQWAAALPHYLHPVEELYGAIRGQLKSYKTPPFEAALKVLANTVKAKKAGEDYVKAKKAVDDVLATADAGLRAKQTDWNSFTVEAALEVLKTASDEYEEAIVRGKIGKPVEYQDARGFIWQAEKMIESVSSGLEAKNADALKIVRTGIAALKAIFPTAMPPRTPVKDYGALLSDVSRIELAAGKLM